MTPWNRRDLRRLAACFSLAACLPGCEEDSPPAGAEAAGKLLFSAYCAACHEPGGAEGPGFAPPLAGSPWVSGPEARLIRIVLHGLRGPIEAGGRTYNLEMPGFGGVLTDAQVANLLSHLRSREASPPIAPETVARVRAAARDRTAYWTVAELHAAP